jgi:hypothetical protein
MEKAIAEAEYWLKWIRTQWGCGKVIIQVGKDRTIRTYPEPSPPMRKIEE